jgi:hypothetical protein
VRQPTHAACQIILQVWLLAMFIATPNKAPSGNSHGRKDCQRPNTTQASKGIRGK